MNITLFKSLLALVFASCLFIWSFLSFRKKRNISLLIQLIGSVGIIIVALVHIFEAERWFEFMQWGSPHSLGHYLDLSSAILGITLFSVGFVLSKIFK